MRISHFKLEFTRLRYTETMTVTLEPQPVPLRADQHGVLRVGRTRVTLDLVIYAFLEGATPEDIVQRYTALELGDVYAVIAYYLRHKDTPFAHLYREAAKRAGRDPATLPLSINSHGFIADDARQAAEDYYPVVSAAMNKIGRERGWPPMTREQFDFSRTLRGSDFIGGPDEVIEKILFQHGLFNHQRFLLQLGVGSMGHQKMLRGVELLGTKVAPVVRAEIVSRISSLTAVN